MELSTVQQILLSILAAALALFLVLAIAIAIMVIQFIKKLRQIADKAEKVVDSAETIGTIFKNAATPVGAFHFIQKVVDMAVKHKKK
jgi:type II secretory pathway component PulF